MPSVDVVSRVNIQSLDNAVNNVRREIIGRFDFKNVPTEVTLDRKAKRIHIVSGDDMKVKAIVDMLTGQCIRLKVDPKCLDPREIEETSHNTVKMDIHIKEGLSDEIRRSMVKYIKGLKMKVQAAMQEDHVRITGKQKDDLQAIIKLLREEDYDIPLQFINMKD